MISCYVVSHVCTSARMSSFFWVPERMPQGGLGVKLIETCFSGMYRNYKNYYYINNLYSTYNITHLWLWSFFYYPYVLHVLLQCPVMGPAISATSTFTFFRFIFLPNLDYSLFRRNHAPDFRFKVFIVVTVFGHTRPGTVILLKTTPFIFCETFHQIV